MISGASSRVHQGLKLNFRATAALALATSQLWISDASHAQIILKEDCRSCHPMARSGMSLTGFVGTTNLGAGTLKLFTVRPGQTAAIGINVTDGHDRYALSLSKLGVGGINNTNNHLVYQPDPNWLDNSNFFTTPVLTVNQSFTYNLGVKTNTPPDFYLLNMDLAGLSDPVTNHWDQFEQFYLQVLSTNPPASQILNPVLNGGTFSLSILTVAGFTYHLEYADLVTNPSWTPIGQVPGDGTVRVLSDPHATVSQRFYRVRTD